MSFSSIPVLEIFIPFVAFGITILCCTTFCKAIHRAREERLEREEQRRRSPVFVIPFPRLPHDPEDPHRPPRYSVATQDFHIAPPPYHEVEIKPDVFSSPEGLPPAYTEYSHPPHFPSAPPQHQMEQPPLHQQP